MASVDIILVIEAFYPGNEKRHQNSEIIQGIPNAKLNFVFVHSQERGD